MMLGSSHYIIPEESHGIIIVARARARVCSKIWCLFLCCMFALVRTARRCGLLCDRPPRVRHGPPVKRCNSPTFAYQMKLSGHPETIVRAVERDYRLRNEGSTKVRRTILDDGNQSAHVIQFCCDASVLLCLQQLGNSTQVMQVKLPKWSRNRTWTPPSSPSPSLLPSLCATHTQLSLELPIPAQQPH